jgi:hypothetical protein
MIGLTIIAPWGWLAALAVLALLDWYVLDWLLPRRAVHRLFGRSEPVLSHRLRFVRQVALFGILIVAVAVTLVQLLGASDNGSRIPSAAATPLAGITTAFLASFGWLYTRFEQEKAERARATQEAIKRFYDESNMSQHRTITALAAEYRRAHGFPGGKPFPPGAFDEYLEIESESAAGTKVRKRLREALDRFFNILNQIAFGVRQGELDYQTVEMILRPRYIQFGFVFFEYIRQETKAEQESDGRWRSQTRTWEHMLWLTSRLPMLKTDGTDWQHIVMPPDHIVGVREGERLRPPPSPRRSGFRLDWERIASGMDKLSGRVPPPSG